MSADRKALSVLLGIGVLLGAFVWWLTSGFSMNSGAPEVHWGVPSPTITEAAQRFASTLAANDSRRLREMVSEDNIKRSVVPEILDRYGGRPVRAVTYTEDDNDGSKHVLFDVGCRSATTARFEARFEWQDTDLGSGWVMWSGGYISSHGAPTTCPARTGAA